MTTGQIIITILGLYIGYLAYKGTLAEALAVIIGSLLSVVLVVAVGFWWLLALILAIIGIVILINGNS